jgi:MFS transporter, ACS family, pantothenate transporter
MTNARCLCSPAYDGLTNNVATRLMKTKLHSWPEGTADFVNHRILEEYIQETARKTKVDKSTIFGAKVTQVEKHGKKWNLKYETLRSDAIDGKDWKQKHELVGYHSTVKKKISDSL